MTNKKSKVKSYARRTKSGISRVTGHDRKSKRNRNIAIGLGIGTSVLALGLGAKHLAKKKGLKTNVPQAQSVSFKPSPSPKPTVTIETPSATVAEVRQTTQAVVDKAKELKAEPRKLTPEERTQNINRAARYFKNRERLEIRRSEAGFGSSPNNENVVEKIRIDQINRQINSGELPSEAVSRLRRMKKDEAKDIKARLWAKRNPKKVENSKKIRERLDRLEAADETSFDRADKGRKNKKIRKQSAKLLAETARDLRAKGMYS